MSLINNGKRKLRFLVDGIFHILIDNTYAQKIFTKNTYLVAERNDHFVTRKCC